MFAVSNANTVDRAAEETRQQIVDLMQDFTVETTPGSAAKIADYRDHLRPGDRVAVTFLPGSDFADTVATAKRLREEGFLGQILVDEGHRQEAVLGGKEARARS